MRDLKRHHIDIGTFFRKRSRAVTPAAKEEVSFDDSILSESEKQAVDTFAGQIDLTNSAVILQYGAGNTEEDGGLFREGP